MSRVVSAPSVGLYMRGLVVGIAVAGLFAAVGAQLVRLSMVERPEIRVASAEPIGRVFARPDILDRGGRLVATDVAVPSLYADPALIIDLDEVIEKLTRTFSDLDAAELRKALGDRTRRFAWIKRGLAPRQAQRVHDLGLPGLAFRQEPKRVYPAGALLGHLVGYVNVDNKGAGGLERYIDDNLGIESVLGAAPSRIRPVALSIDLGVQQALAAELKEALTRYQASGAAGLVMDVTTGELVAAVSLPELDPEKPVEAQADGRLDRLSTGVYELGSIFKILTVAMALDEKTATLDKIYDVRQPMTVRPAHDQRPASGGPAAQRARRVHPFVERRRGHDRAGGRECAADRLSVALRAAVGRAHGSWGRWRHRSCRSVGARSRP